DVADYSEWTNHRRATAIIFSAMLCGLKVGLSIGGALVAAILAHYGYATGGGAQSDAVTDGVRLAISVYCSIPFLLAVGLLFFYRIDKAMENRLESELGERRVAAEVTA
ncbi:MFS transporter, partial [Acinetobacter schindleri]|uniref:MFS transporter n=1 Tax=Acinetobacter schindleri TaxID=108981 RepID=UPI0030FAC75C